MGLVGLEFFEERFELGDGAGVWFGLCEGDAAGSDFDSFFEVAIFSVGSGEGAEESVVLVVGSLAGGRKSMSALLHVCFCLCGSPRDRLTHVLVNHPFDKYTSPLFHFPTHPPQHHHHLDRETGTELKISSTEAKLELATIPFFPLRGLDSKDIARGDSDFMDLVYSLRGAILKDKVTETPQVYLEMGENRLALHCDNIRISLSPQQFIIYLVLAQYASAGQKFNDQRDCLQAYSVLVQEIPNNDKYPATLRGKARSWQEVTSTAPLRSRLGEIRDLIAVTPLSKYIGKIIPQDRAKPNIEIEFLGIGSKSPQNKN